MTRNEEIWRLNHIDGLTYAEIGKKLGISACAAKQAAHRWASRPRDDSEIDSVGEEVLEKHSTVFKDGTYTFTDTFAGDGSAVTPESVLISKNFEVSAWTVKAFTVNSWEQQVKGGGKITLCQTKLVASPKQAEITLDDIDALFKKATKSTSKTKMKPRKLSKGSEALEIDFADLHCGLLSWAPESGSDFDITECKIRFLNAIEDILERGKGRDFTDIYVCGLGDILHADNFKSTTTNGTMQDMDTRITKAIDAAFDMMYGGLCAIKAQWPNATVHYIYLCGNHDTLTGYTLVKMLELALPDVIFDTRPNPQKAFTYGCNLIGLTHGDMPKYNKGTWLINDYREDFGRSHFVEEHCGHIHHEEAKMYNGIMVRSVMAQCGNSYWEHKEGYRANKGLQCFVWNADIGLRESWYYYF